MSYSEVKSNIFSNAVSNYIRTVIGMVVGLLTFRLLYQYLNLEQFGFWSLLWSVFGYGVLLDFGFGFAAQKRVAELSVSKDWAQLSRVLSTILFFYLGMAAALILVVLLSGNLMLKAFDVSADHATEFKAVMVVFFIGIGLAFPMGIFPEILRGQQRIRLANNISSVAMLIRLGLIWAAVHNQWSFMAIMFIAIFFSLAPDFLSAFFALRRMPEVKLRPRLFSRKMMSGTMQFSIFAYITTATNVVLGKTDQLVISASLGIAAVAIYQAGAKVSEIFSQFTRQVQDTLSPAAAHLHATGDHEALKDLIMLSLRWSVIIATPLYLLCGFYLQELLQLLTGDGVIPKETWLTGQVLLFWFYVSILTHSVSKRIYMMSGHERKLMWMGLGEAVINLAISVVLVITFKSIVAVAVGSLIPTLYYGWVHLWPWMARDANLSSWGLLKKAVLPTWLACLPVLTLLSAAACWPASRLAKPWQTILVHGPIAGGLAMILLWRIAIPQQQKSALLRRLPYFRSRLSLHGAAQEAV